MKSEINIPKELYKEIEDYAETEGISVKEFIFWALGEKVGALRERLGVKNLSRINPNPHSQQPLTSKNNQLTTNPKPLLKAIEVAKHLCISKSAAYHLMKTGEIQIVKFGKIVRVREEDLESYIYKSKA